MDRDRDLLLGVMALLTGLIDTGQFHEARARVQERPGASLADALLERGWIAAADRQNLEHLVQRILHKHHDNARNTLAALPTFLKESLSALEGLDSECTLAVMSAAVEAGPEGPLSRHPASDPGVDARYDSLRLHGVGGIGQVWRARDRHLDREIALKELLPRNAGNAKVAARFVREARLTGQLEHPGIVPVYELAFRANSQEPFYTMRLVRGQTLSDAIAAYHAARAQGRAEPLDFVRLLTSFVAVCNTIAYAHSRGVLHRDLKGDNVVVGDFGEVIVLDWGLAKVMGQPEADDVAPANVEWASARDSGLTVQGEIVGTPAYMAPEQAEGRQDRIDQRTDIYGLGGIFYEILTGRPPFVGANSFDVLRQVMRGNPLPPREILSEVPAALEAVCLKALARDPNQRYGSASELAQEVQRWQDVQRRQAEDALRASEEQYRSLADFIPGIVWTSLPDGSIDFANEFWSNYTGMTLEQTKGAGWATMLHPEDLQRVSAIWATALQTGEPVEIEYRLKRSADGAFRWFLARGKAMRDRGGRIVKWFGMLTDIEDQKQGEKTLERQNSLVRLLYQVTVAAYEAVTFEQALQAGIDQVCAYTGWPVGHVYVRAGRDPVLTPTSIWHLDRPEEFASFVRVTQATPLVAGAGLPGRVLTGKEPLWIMDVTRDENFPRAKAATDIGVKGAFAFPVLTPAGVVAVLEFFTSEPSPPDELLLQGMVQIGIQLGQVFERNRNDPASRAP